MVWALQIATAMDMPIIIVINMATAINTRITMVMATVMNPMMEITLHHKLAYYEKLKA